MELTPCRRSIAGGLGCPASRAWASIRVSPRMSRTAAGAATPNREPYHFHFPDGNASIARLLVRTLIAEAVPGHTVEDIVTTRINYARLDQPGAAVRIRLGSPRSARAASGRPRSIARSRGVLRAGAASVRCAWAWVCPGCWHADHPVPVSGAAREAESGMSMWREGAARLYQRRPRNWTALHQLGVRTIAAPGCATMRSACANRSVLAPTGMPTRPRLPCCSGWCARLPAWPPSARAASTRTSGAADHAFATFERHLRDELGRMPAGFDPARDIVAITVNRWPHGYAYEYNPLWDPEKVPEEDEPCVIARQPFGRITIANSDAAAYAYTDAAIDQGYRAVQELVLTWGASTNARHESRPEAGAPRTL